MPSRSQRPHPRPRPAARFAGNATFGRGRNIPVGEGRPLALPRGGEGATFGSLETL
jgi:hypothetical protein